MPANEKGDKRITQQLHLPIIESKLSVIESEIGRCFGVRNDRFPYGFISFSS